MTYPPDQTPPTADVGASTQPDLMPAKIIYALFALGYFNGITALAGLIYAYISKGKNEVLDSHLSFQIQTFWISVVIGILAFITMFIGIGFLIYLFLAVWGLLRVISGFLLANEGKPITGTKHAGMMAF